jgi:alpha-tubulin suppressor-like RCC1 family protein
MRSHLMQRTPRRRRHGAVLIGLCLALLLNLVQAVAGPTTPAAADAASLTLWADAAGREALLGSPWDLSLAAGGNPQMQRLAAGAYHSLAIKPDGSLWAWGSFSGVQFGLPPVQVLTGVAAVAAGEGYTLALKPDGNLWAWGDNSYGQLGDGTTAQRSTPIQVQTEVAAVAAHYRHSLALKPDGSLWVWGWNSYGQLGDGTTTDRLMPVQVLTEVAAVTSGSQHTLALKTDGSLWAWGWNNYGQLGDGTATDRLMPVQVLTEVAAVAGGGDHTLALKTDGSLWAWGDNNYGQLGDGTATARLMPVQVLTEVAAVAAGAAHSLALKIDGSLWAWGSNYFGELGDGTTTDRWMPVQVLTEVAAMTAGNSHTLARKTDGSLWAWGYNTQGQLGDGTTTHSPSPVSVIGFEGPPLTTYADFTVTNITRNPSAPLVGRSFNVSITVKNRGTQAGNPGLLRVWANQPTAPGCAVAGDADLTLADLAAGAKQTVSIRLPAGPAGTKTLRAFVDSQCLSTEPNETNNQSTQAYRVLSTPTPDFAVTAIAMTPNRPTVGTTFSATVTVKNRGTAPGDAGVLALWVDQPGVPACGAAGDAMVSVGTLAAGASRTLTLDGLPAGVAAAKSLRAFIDATCVSAEAYDTNNQWVKPYTVIP